MPTRSYIILTILFSLLQGPLLPVVFFEGLLFTLYYFQNDITKVAPFLFVSGLIWDGMQNQMYGTTSVIFLVSALLLLILSNFSLQKALYIALVAVFVNLGRSLILFSSVSVWALAIIFFMTLVLVNFWHPSGGKIKI